MPYQVGTACYGTALQAAQAQASTQVGGFVQQGQVTYAVSVASIAEDSITYNLKPLDAQPVLSVQVPYTAQPCNLLTAQDGIELGWMVIACWLAVYGITFLARIFKGETGGEYGNA